MTHGLHGVARDGAHGRERVARAHKNGIRRVAKVVATGELTLLVEAQVVAGRSRETEPRRGHGLTRCFEGDDQETVG